MRDAEKNEFAQVMRSTFDSYGRQAPLPETMRLWWEMLVSFDIAAVRMAFQRHIVAEPKFPPTIGQILELLGAKEKTGRIGAEEAWSIAVRACDETETVVMNDQIAEAWGIAQPIFNLGDEVGARMAFKEAYQRITANAKEAPKWWPSIGSDPHKRDSALSEAKRQGVLPAPHVEALLPPPAIRRVPSEEPEGLTKLKEMMKGLQMKRIARSEDEESS